MTQGLDSSALIQAGVTPHGTGKALQLVASATPVTVTRPATYGGLKPTWVRFRIRPGGGGEPRCSRRNRR